MSQLESQHNVPYSLEECRQARLSRDARFDGQFFTGVFSTGIYCRPICPAVAPKEKNVGYFTTAIEAASAGLRPCLRCRPDSAPHSCAWNGNQTSLERALNLIDSGALNSDQGLSIEALAEKLGITSRYLRQLFTKKLGVSPKQYAIYSQLMFAKQLLHQTRWSITQIALASGFNSVRRFNEAFAQHLQMTPTRIRQSQRDKEADNTDSQSLSLKLTLAYRPNFNWQVSHHFYRFRAVEAMEWLTDDGYGRSFCLDETRGYFQLTHQAEQHCFLLELQLAHAEDIRHVRKITMKIRNMLDLDLDMSVIEQHLSQLSWLKPHLVAGLRLPKTWSVFEAGCRAVLGQQVSVKQASSLLNQLVAAYGDKVVIGGREVRLFPSAEAIANASLEELKMPGARKAGLKALALYVDQHPDAPPDEWISVKGIGPWTIAYAKMRGAGEANIMLASDLIIKQQLIALSQDSAATLSAAEYTKLAEDIAQRIAPWGSYLTLQLWHQALLSSSK